VTVLSWIAWACGAALACVFFFACVWLLALAAFGADELLDDRGRQ
jgi:hypothetical protein